MTKKIGIIGVGLLGGALAHRLARQGWKVIGHDPFTTPIDAIPMYSCANKLITECKTVLLSLPSSDVTIDVIDSIKGAITTHHCFSIPRQESQKKWKLLAKI